MEENAEKDPKENLDTLDRKRSWGSGTSHLSDDKGTLQIKVNN